MAHWDMILWGKVPVPYTALWSAESPPTFWETVRVAEFHNATFLVEGDPLPGVPLADRGKPLFSTFHTGRALAIVRDGACQICLEPLDRRGFSYATPAYAIGFGQVIRGRPHITDGLPMCAGCTELAIEHCPALQERVASGVARVYRVSEFQLAPPVLGILPEGGGVASAAVNAALRRHQDRWRHRAGLAPVVFGTPKLMLERFHQVEVRDGRLVLEEAA